MTNPPGGPHYQPPYGPPPPGYPAPPGYAQPGYPAPGQLPAPGVGYPTPPPGYGQPPGAPPGGYGPPFPPAPTGGYGAVGTAPGAPPPANPSPYASPTAGYPAAGAPGGYGPPGAGYPPAGASAFAPLPTGVPGFGPPGVAAPGAGGPPVVVDVGRTNARKAVIGATVAGVIGLIALVSGIFGAVDGGIGVGMIAVVIGLLFLILPVGLVVRRDKVFRPQHLVFDAAGLRWDDPRGAPWMVPWSELAAVAISKHSPKSVGPESLQDKIVGAASDRIAGERAHVRLDFFPADPGFAGRHPEIAHLWERQGVQNGYRLPLGSNVKFIPVIASAMGRFAPHVYRGVNATEGFYGLS
ncbi:hypothetical protein [Actinophytocola sp.]|uniref:hypothetical protein n=1 Tax=Actinophytocola sp. TaxID=1872138 RepID=UPI00389AF889